MRLSIIEDNFIVGYEGCRAKRLNEDENKPIGRAGE